MSLTVAVQMDPIQNVKIAGDTTFGLLLEAACCIMDPSACRCAKGA
jgi:hypothetical protein